MIIYFKTITILLSLFTILIITITLWGDTITHKIIKLSNKKRILKSRITGKYKMQALDHYGWITILKHKDLLKHTKLINYKKKKK